MHCCAAGGRPPLPSFTVQHAFAPGCWWQRPLVPGVCFSPGLSVSSLLGLLTVPCLICFPPRRTLWTSAFAPVFASLAPCWMLSTPHPRSPMDTNQLSIELFKVSPQLLVQFFSHKNLASLFSSLLLITWFSLLFSLFSLQCFFFQLHFLLMLKVYIAYYISFQCWW